jgi:predicted Zn-ribbon and HTH transcriptional regulator
MRNAERTTRQRIADFIRDRPAQASALAEEFDITRGDVFTHVEHIAESLDDEQQRVAPPECRDCGFDGFDDRVNYPSRCPECKSESIEEPAFTIE